MLEYKFMAIDFTCEVYSVTCLVWLLFVAGAVRTNKGRDKQMRNTMRKAKAGM